MGMRDFINKVKGIFSKQKALPEGIEQEVNVPSSNIDTRNEYIEKLQEETKREIEKMKEEELATAKTPEELKECILKQAGIDNAFLGKRLVREKLVEKLDKLISEETGKDYQDTQKFLKTQGINSKAAEKIPQDYMVNDVNDIRQLRTKAGNIVNAVETFWNKTENGIAIAEPINYKEIDYTAEQVCTLFEKQPDNGVKVIETEGIGYKYGNYSTSTIYGKRQESRYNAKGIEMYKSRIETKQETRIPDDCIDAVGRVSGIFSGDVGKADWRKSEVLESSQGQLFLKDNTPGKTTYYIRARQPSGGDYIENSSYPKGMVDYRTSKDPMRLYSSLSDSRAVAGKEDLKEVIDNAQISKEEKEALNGFYGFSQEIDKENDQAPEK